MENLKNLSPQDAVLVRSHLSDSDVELRRQFRLSLQYGAVASALLLAAYWLQSLWPMVALWAVFLMWLVVRYRSLKHRGAALNRIFNTLDIGPLDK